jgi:putative membrane protein
MQDIDAMTEGRADAGYPLLLLGLFSVWFLALGIAPWYREDWLLENVLVFVAVPVLVWSYRRLRFSNAAYTLMFVFFCLHELGAHYTYAEVPYDEWFRQLSGRDIQSALGFGRNHYDRLVHFSYGLLMLPAVIELLQARGALVGWWRNLVPLFFIMANSELFELIEWQAAEIFGGPLGQAYLGTQGDIWDAQKDSAMAAIGALIALVLYRMHEARTRRR